jgi:hypothetical protein|tara:strand:+ start:22 stop:141 length:120 start_codon:yes stop_codon:yes gene_type:complete
MAVRLRKARYNDEDKWKKLLYKLEALINRIEMLLKRVKS